LKRRCPKNEIKEYVLCPILKKGDPLIASNYRGISLLDIAYKILSYILFNRLLDNTEQIFSEYQFRLRPGKSTIIQIIEKTAEFHISIHHLFIDFNAAYDSINRKRLYSATEEFGITKEAYKTDPNGESRMLSRG
jgi:hypothetical protein